MGRYRSRSRSYSPARRSRSPPRHRKQYDEPPRDRYRGGGGGGGGGGRSFRDRHSSPPTGLLIRNISLDARPEDLRIPFERFGPVKDVYLPKNYYTGEPRGFGFVKYRNADDAAEAMHQMNHQVIGGREITIVYAEENRKTPQEMRITPRSGGRYGGSSRRRTPPRSPRRRYHSHSLSPSPPRRESRLSKTNILSGVLFPQSTEASPFAMMAFLQGRDSGAREDYYSPRRSVSRSRSPHNKRDNKSGPRSPSPKGNGRSPNDRSPSRSPSYSPRR